ncbi:MAG: methyltransferase [Pseudomonadota bacterium]
MTYRWMPLAAALAITACGQTTDTPPAEDTDVAALAVEAKTTMDTNGETTTSLTAVLDAQSDEHKARYAARNPAETLAFFGIEPGMTVVEALPGGGWYSKILAPYLGRDGKLIGTDYSMDMWPLFGMWSDEQIEQRRSWTATFIEGAQEWRGDDGALIDAFVFGNMDERFNGTADAVLMIRALHNLNRFESDGGFRTTALDNAFTALKPGGVLGVVQHRAPADNDDDWADGSNGYLKQQALIDAITAAGFEFVEASEINANDADQPTNEEFVWRLPPSLATSGDDDALRAEMLAVGESDRMTLKFIKPAS